MDALKATPGLDVVFGINDDSTRAAMDAAQRLDRAVLAYGVGGESPSFVAGLLAGPSLRAVAALFPEVVGERAIDVAASTLGGDRVPREVLTPHEILTPDNLHEFYRRHEGDWSLRDEIRDRLVGATMAFRSLRLEGRVGFMPQFPAHEWYRAMSRAMHRRCAHYGLELSVVSPEQGVFEELGRLRSLVAASALERVRAGDTIVIGHGDCGSRLADAIRVACAGGDGRLSGGVPGEGEAGDATPPHTAAGPPGLSHGKAIGGCSASCALHAVVESTSRSVSKHGVETGHPSASGWHTDIGRVTGATHLLPTLCAEWDTDSPVGWTAVAPSAPWSSVHLVGR